jgi:hypothetical protein
MEEYLTTIELSERIKMAPGTIRNMVCQKKFIKGIHYVKPTSRKLLFVWSEIQAWLRGDSGCMSTESKTQAKSLINI